MESKLYVYPAQRILHCSITVIDCLAREFGNGVPKTSIAAPTVCLLHLLNGGFGPGFARSPGFFLRGLKARADRAATGAFVIIRAPPAQARTVTAPSSTSSIKAHRLASSYLQRILTAKVYDVARETALEPAKNLGRRIGNTVLLGAGLATGDLGAATRSATSRP